jgi:hypothetical protein
MFLSIRNFCVHEVQKALQNMFYEETENLLFKNKSGCFLIKLPFNSVKNLTVT